MRQCTVLHTARSYAVAQNAEHGETTSKWQIYDDPSIYDRVFAEREFEEEVNCLPHGHALQIKLSWMTVDLLFSLQFCHETL